MDRYRPEKMDTKEHGKPVRVLFKLEKREVRDRNAEGWMVERETTRGTRKECKRQREEFEVEGFMAQTGNVGRQKSTA